MTKLICDIETNGLLYNVDTVWCISIKDVDSPETTDVYYGNTIVDALERLSNADKIIGHNWCGYDAIVLEKLYGFKFDNSKVIDTMLMSNILNPDITGGHSLNAWGERLGVAKPEHEDWSKLSDEMLHRNKQDVEITYLLWKRLTKESYKYAMGRALLMEQKFAYIIGKQEMFGWLIDQDKLDALIQALEFDLAVETDYLLKLLPLNAIKVNDDKVTKGLTKDGKRVTAIAEKYLGHNNIGGDFCKVEFKKIDLGSDKQVKEYLSTIGWEPDTWNYKKDPKTKKMMFIDGQPVKASGKITESSLAHLTSDIGRRFRKRFTIAHRIAYLTGERGIKTLIRPDGRIGGGAITCGTNTGRVKHRGIVNVPSTDKPYGKEIRSLFIAPKGYVVAGADLSSLEYRIASHYTFPYDDGELRDRLLEGDPHQYTADAIGMSDNRKLGKTLNYALQYGGTKTRVKILMGTTDEDLAADIYEKYWGANVAMVKVIDDLKQFLVDNDLVKCYFDNRQRKLVPKELLDGAYVPCIDDRPMFVRSLHSLLSTLIQSAGSVINKMVTNYLYDKCIADKEMDAHPICNYHDENDYQIKDTDYARKMFKQYFEEACIYTNKRLGLNVPIVGDVKFGKSWAETH